MKGLEILVEFSCIYIVYICLYINSIYTCGPKNSLVHMRVENRSLGTSHDLLQLLFGKWVVFILVGLVSDFV